MALSSLSEIRKKVRRLTRSLSESLLSTTELDQYINTFVLNDFPEHLRLFNLESTFTFYSEPYKDVYETSTDTTSSFFDFNNKYITLEPPLYIGGYRSQFSQSRSDFFELYKLINSIIKVGTGNGTVTQFSGTVNVMDGTTRSYVLIRNNVLFSSIDANGNSLAMIDFPINATTGNLYAPGGSPTSETLVDAANTINYVTGKFTVKFATAPAKGKSIDSHTIPTQPSLPQSLLFYDNKITLRPIPDKAYKIELNAFIRPTELLSGTQNPKLNEWWQYISYGAAKKVFEDRMDLESVQLILPEFKKQEALINRRTIVQRTSQRSSTIYTQNISSDSAYSGGQFGGTGSF